MTETFTALLLAHVLADFVFQTNWMVKNKARFHVFLLHGAVVVATASATLGAWSPWLLALLGAHLATDAIKVYGRFTGIAGFLTDQGAHLVALALIAWAAPQMWSGGIWAGLLPGWGITFAALMAGFIVATRAGGFAVGLLMQRFSQDAPKDGLTDAGIIIGLLERGLIFLLVIAGQPSGVGFLIAAKSVLRFGAAAEDRKASEYVIIGTLASFGWALTATYATLMLVAALPPLEFTFSNP